MEFFFLHKSIHWNSTKPETSRERFNNQGRNELQKLKENRIAKAGDYEARRRGLTELNILKQTYIHNELVNSAQCFWKRLPFQQATWVFKDASSDGFPNKISVNHFISPNLFCEEQLFISIKPWNRWLAGDGGVLREGWLEDAHNEVPEKGDFLTIKPWSEPERGTLLPAAVPPSLWEFQAWQRGKGCGDKCFGKDQPGRRLWDLLLGNAGPAQPIFLEFVLLYTLPQASLRYSVDCLKKIVK